MLKTFISTEKREVSGETHYERSSKPELGLNHTTSVHHSSRLAMIGLFACNLF